MQACRATQNAQAGANPAAEAQAGANPAAQEGLTGAAAAEVQAGTDPAAQSRSAAPCGGEERQEEATRLLLVRHGQSLSNESGIFTGQTDVPLSALGERQAAALCRYLLQNYAIDAVYASDLRRACATVQPAAEALGLPIRRERALREIWGGAWEGKPVSFIAQHYAADYALWRTDIGLSHCTGGESMRALQARAAQAVQAIADANAGKTVLIATHAAFLRALQCYWQGIPLEKMKEVPWVPNASVTEVWMRGREAHIVRLAEVSFLHGEVTRLSAGI